LWARRVAATLGQRQLLELGCAVLRLPVLSRIARHVFFGRGSFPDVEETTAFGSSPRCAVEPNK